MYILIERAAGLGVHKETVVASVMGTGIKKETKTFTAMTNDLIRLQQWLKEHSIPMLPWRAPESTGNPYSTYWRTPSK